MRTRQIMISATSLATVLIGVTMFQNCGSKGSNNNSSSAGPVDGNYRMTTFSCGNRNILGYYSQLGVASVTYTINNTSASEVFTLGSGCQATSALGISYVDSSHVAVTQGAVACSANCGSQCTPEPASPTPIPEISSYTLSGSTLALTGSVSTADLNSGSDMSRVGCQVGDPITTILIRQ